MHLAVLCDDVPFYTSRKTKNEASITPSDRPGVFQVHPLTMLLGWVGRRSNQTAGGTTVSCDQHSIASLILPTDQHQTRRDGKVPGGRCELGLSDSGTVKL